MTETSRFRDLHSRTHEVELLISGALVFGLSQAPGYIESTFQWWILRLDGLTGTAATYLFVYAELLAYSLLGTFILHLCLRGYWAALLGLESVWPDGWNSTALKFGPYGRRHADQMFSSLSSSIDRADDRASVLFAAGTLLALVFVYSLMLVMLSLAVGFGVSLATGGRVSGVVGLVTTFSLLLALTAALGLIDRFYGDKIAPHTRVGRWFASALGLSMRVSAARWTGPVQFVFQTHLGEKKLGAALATAAGLMALVVIGGFVWRVGLVRIDGWKYFDDTPAATYFDPRYYRNSATVRDGLLPSIDADVITGPYLKLYLPYRPGRHNPLLEKRCPQTVGSAASAACVGGLYTVTLGGQSVPALTYDFTRDTPSEFVGVVTFIDVRNLPAGRHELAIQAPPREEGETLTITIPFYR